MKYLPRASGAEFIDNAVRFINTAIFKEESATDGAEMPEIPGVCVLSSIPFRASRALGFSETRDFLARKCRRSDSFERSAWKTPRNNNISGERFTSRCQIPTANDFNGRVRSD